MRSVKTGTRYWVHSYHQDNFGLFHGAVRARPHSHCREAVGPVVQSLGAIAV